MEEPDNVTTLEELVMRVLEKLDYIESTLARYEPLLAEAERRLAGPLNFRRKA